MSPKKTIAPRTNYLPKSVPLARVKKKKNIHFLNSFFDDNRQQSYIGKASSRSSNFVFIFYRLTFDSGARTEANSELG